MRIPTASYDQPSRSSGRLVNCFAEKSVGKAPVNVVGCPGIRLTKTLESPGRGLAVHNGILYALSGDTFYRADTGAVIGTIPGSALVTFASTGTELVTDNGYFFNGTVSAISDIDKVPWSTVDYCDGRAVFVETDTGRFGATSLYDLSSIDGLDYATAEGAPDKLLSLIVDHRQVVLFGLDSVEVWWNSGAAGFPFERIANGFIELGALSRLGRCKADNSIYWLASDKTFRRLSGSTPVRVSQHGVEEALRSYSVVDDCHAYSYTWQGHIFVVFRFPTEGKTWVLDVTTGEWHEREGYHRRAWDVVSSVTHDGKVWVQHQNGSVGYIDDVPTEFGQLFRQSITFPNIYSAQSRQFFAQIDFALKTGTAANFTLEVSHDGGSLFHALPVQTVSAGYDDFLRWNRLGHGRDTVFRLSSDAPFTLVDAQLIAQKGTP